MVAKYSRQISIKMRVIRRISAQRISISESHTVGHCNTREADVKQCIIARSAERSVRNRYCTVCQQIWFESVLAPKS